MVKKTNLPAHGMQECVLMRKAPEGEFDLEISESLCSLVRDVVDTGTNVIREGQQEEKQKAAAEQISASVLEGTQKAKVYSNPMEHVLANALSMQAKDITVHEPVGAVDGSGGDIDDSEDGGDDGTSSLLSSLLGLSAAASGGRVFSGKSSRGGAEGGGGSRSSGGFLGGAVAAATPAKVRVAKSVGAEVSPGVPDSPAAGKGRGKQARIPIQVESLLEFEKVPDKVRMVKLAMARLKHEDFCKQVIDMKVAASTNSVCKDIQKVVKTFTADMKATKKRLDTRLNTPEAAKVEVNNMIHAATVLVFAISEVQKYPGPFCLSELSEWQEIEEIWDSFTWPFA